MAIIIEMDDAPASFETPYSMQAGDTFQGTLDSDDISDDETVMGSDRVRVDLLAGYTYGISLVGRGDDPVDDPMLRLYDANGNVLVLDDNVFFPDDLNSFIEFTASVSGTYYLYVTGRDTGDYELAVSEGDPSPGPGITRSGGHGNDVLSGSSGDDVLWGGGGDDTLQGSRGMDRLVGGRGNDVLEGGRGGDTLEGARGDDILYGGSEDDVLLGARGDDVLYGSTGNDRLWGGGGDDRLDGGEGADQLSGGSGRDTVDYSDSSAGVVVNLANGMVRGGHAEQDTISGFENLAGSAHDDHVIGGSADNEISGGAGNDMLIGRAGNDRLDGGAGDDTLAGGAGNDTLTGVRGNDTLTGGSGDDVLSGGSGRDLIMGGRDNDHLIGGADNDMLIGGAGVDRLEGGRGGDGLAGGTGDDYLIGGSGEDRFVFDPRNGTDTIADFRDGEDFIDLSSFGLTDFSDMTLSSEANGVTIDLSDHGGGSILLRGADIADLDASDFLL